MADTPTFPTPGRLAAAVLAALAWLGLGRYLAAEMARQGGDVLAALWQDAAFLTDLSNALLAGVLTGVALGNRTLSRPGTVGFAVAAAVTVGLAFWLVGGRLSLDSDLENLLLHGVTPAGALLFWLLWTPKRRLRWGHALAWMAWPALYWSYALLRGRLTGEYAYPFTDPAQAGMLPVLRTLGMLFATHALVAVALVAMDRRWPPRRRG